MGLRELDEHRDNSRFERVVEREEALARVPLRESGQPFGRGSIGRARRADGSAPPSRESLHTEAGAQKDAAYGIHLHGWRWIGTAAEDVIRYQDGGRDSI